ncbi:MAG: phosphoribosylanthranilate isomerase [Nitrospinota bacterium]|nr:phosphoribosylanthranilate isomerase [Nitrospinota bacterium]
MKVKICGHTRLEDIAFSFDCGAYLCGVVVEVASSKRSVSVDTAIPLFENYRNRMVALTADADNHLLDRIATRLKPGALQLTANETPERVKEIRELYGIPVYKSLHLPADSGTKQKTSNLVSTAKFFIETISHYKKAGADGFILDTSIPGSYGGSGKRSDWGIAKQIIAGTDAKLFLAGGIDPENAAEALKLQPFAIDLASGVETAPGLKSKDKIKALFKAVNSLNDL